MHLNQNSQKEAIMNILNLLLISILNTHADTSDNVSTYYMSYTRNSMSQRFKFSRPRGIKWIFYYIYANKCFLGYYKTLSRVIYNHKWKYAFSYNRWKQNNNLPAYVGWPQFEIIINKNIIIIIIKYSSSIKYNNYHQI